MPSDLLCPCLAQIADLTTELADERFKGDVSCQVLETEHAERLRASRELQEVKVGGQEWRDGGLNGVVGCKGGCNQCSFTSGAQLQVSDSQDQGHRARVGFSWAWLWRCSG